MMVPGKPVRVLVATRPVDFRKGMDGLMALVQEHLRDDPFSGAIFVFRSKRADRVKLVGGTDRDFVCSPSVWRMAGSIGRPSKTGR